MDLKEYIRQKPWHKAAVYAMVFVLAGNMAVLPALAQDASTTAAIITGDASAGIDSGTSVNQNDTTVASGGSAATTDGSSTIDDNGSATTTGDIVSVNNDNTATTSNTLDGSAATGDNQTGTTSGDALIDTGGAKVISGAGTDANGNYTAVDCPDCEASTTIAVDNGNTASTSNQVKLDGGTGGNQTASAAGSAYIETGDVGIVNVIINFINKNIFGQGREFLVNIWNKVTENIDLSGHNQDEPAQNSGDYGACEAANCYVSLSNKNSGQIVNDVVINAQSGQNQIDAAGTSAVISTGDINITNDVINIANLNISGNDWFFAVVNIFGELKGDLILPPAEQPEQASTTIREQIEKTGRESAEAVITNLNEANIANHIDISGDTGNNEIASSAGQAVIRTGEANVRSRVFNLVNYNVYGDTWKFAKVNIMGRWRGFIDNLPANYGYLEDENGITLYSKILDDPGLNKQFALLSVENRNQATTTNNIEINASSGNNRIVQNGGASLIDTGDVNIYNSLLNFINANFTGNNWEFSMINVFGDWQGNLAFGRPDLWITESVKPAGKISREEFVTITFLFGNRGDAMANNVVVVDDFDEFYLSYAGSDNGGKEGGQVVWDIGQLPPNSQGSISYTTRVRGDVPFGLMQAKNQAAIGGDEGDRDPSNNVTGGTITIDGGERSSRGGLFQAASEGGGGAAAMLAVTKTNNAADVVGPGDIVDFQIKISNNGTAAAGEVYLLDIMSDLEGSSEVNRNFWDLSEVGPDEEVVIDYSVEITAGLPTGTYINEVTVEGWDPGSGQYMVAVASSKIKVVNNNPAGSASGPNLTLGTVVYENPLNPGQEFHYRLVLGNNGDEVVENPVVEVLPPVGMTLSDTRHFSEGRWDAGSLNPGQIVDLEIPARVDNKAPAGDYIHTFKVTAGNIGAFEKTITLKVIKPDVLGAEYEQADGGRLSAGLSSGRSASPKSNERIAAAGPEDPADKNAEEPLSAREDRRPIFPSVQAAEPETGQPAAGPVTGDDGLYNIMLYSLISLILLLLAGIVYQLWQYIKGKEKAWKF